MIQYGVYHMCVSTFVTLCIILTFFPSGFSIFGVTSIFRNAFAHIYSDASLWTILLQYLSYWFSFLIISLKILSVVIIFRMSPATHGNPNRDDGEQSDPPPPPPPPPPEAWQALMAAPNANTQMLLQFMQERNQGYQGNQGQGSFNNQPQYATLN